MPAHRSSYPPPPLFQYPDRSSSLRPPVSLLRVILPPLLISSNHSPFIKDFYSFCQSLSYTVTPPEDHRYNGIREMPCMWRDRSAQRFRQFSLRIAESPTGHANLRGD